MLKKLIFIFLAIMLFGANFSFAAKHFLTVKSVDVQSFSSSSTKKDEKGNSGWGTAAGVAAAVILEATPIGWGVLLWGGNHAESKIRGKHTTENATVTVKNIYYVKLSDGSVFVSYFKYEIGEKVDVRKIESKQWVKKV